MTRDSLDTLGANLREAAIAARSAQVAASQLVRVVELRLKYYELYRVGDMMRTHPVTFAVLEEILVLMKAKL